MDLVYWSDSQSSRRGGDGVKGVEGVNRYFSLCFTLLCRVHEDLVKHPVNNISIVVMHHPAAGMYGAMYAVH